MIKIVNCYIPFN